MATNPQPAVEYVRTSILLTKVLDRNIEAYCAIKSKSKNEAMQELLKVALQSAGLQPDKEPREISVAY